MAIFIIIILVVIVLQEGAIWVLRFEQLSPDANIKTGGRCPVVGHRDHYHGRLWR